MAKRLTLFIMIGLVLGILVGAGLHHFVTDAGQREAIAGYFKILTDIFLRLIKMIIAPLVFSTLVSGVVHMGDTSSLGRIGLKTMTWFIGATIVSLALGMVLVNGLQPGSGTNLELPEATAKTGVEGKQIKLDEFITHLVPKSIIESMATNDILPIVIFALFFGVAMASVGEKGQALAGWVDGLVAVMLKITDYVMRVAPIAVFAAMASAITKSGLEILLTFGKFIVCFYFGLGVLWVVLAIAGFLVIGPRLFTLFKLIRDPVLLAFSTASSEAAYPRTLESLDKFGVPSRISSFVLPLGYSFNLDGSMMYMTFAALFIAQLYGMEISWADQTLMLLILMITSKGMAGVPRASLVVISAVMGRFNIPEQGLVLILAVDQFLDMGRSGTNVVGNAIATAVVAKWEGELATPPAVE